MLQFFFEVEYFHSILLGCLQYENDVTAIQVRNVIEIIKQLTGFAVKEISIARDGKTALANDILAVLLAQSIDGILQFARFIALHIPQA
jgi:hypothetical protein